MIRILLTLLIVATLASPLQAADPPTQKPNILIILADDMGFSDAGCYGGEIATPNLDALAQNGLRFTQFYNTARCWPSRAAILTGYYAQQVRRDTVPGIPSGGSGTRPAWARLLPEMLKPLGYRSYHSGKWHVDGKPLQNGFDHSYSLNDHNRHFTPQQHTEDDKPLPPVKAGDGYYSTTAIADHAIKCLKEHAAKYSDRPFFEFLAFTAPHFPLHAPAEDIARYRTTYTAGWDALREARWKRMQELKIGGTALSAVERDVGPPYHFPDALKKLGPNELNRPLPWQELTESQREFQAKKMAVHAAMVDRMDREIGRVVAQLRAMGALDNTLIFFLSDNGASAEIMVRGDGHDPNAAFGSPATFLSIGPGWSTMCNTPFRRHKTWVHEGGIATPLIVHWPKGIAAKGELRHTPGHLIDLLPTVLEVVGGKRFETWAGRPVPPAPGKSLVPVFARDGTVSHDSLWWLHEGNRALRAGNWKIVAAGKDSPWELYDLTSDRSESKNLAADRPDKVRELAALWTKQFEDYAKLAAQDLPREPKPAEPPKKPNILLIYADDQSYKTVGCYPESWPWVKTPNIDALAQSGVRFHGAYLGGWCMPSRASILTGHHPHGIQSMRMEGPYPGSTYDPKQCPFWPALFRANGYHTAQIGKWHTGTDAGFGRDWDYQIVWNRPKHPENAGAYYERELLAFNGVEKWQDGYPADHYTKWAVEYVKGATRDKDKPWFLWLCYGNIHGPSKPAARHKGLYKDAKVPEPADLLGPWPGKPDYLKNTLAWRRAADGKVVAGKSGEKVGDEAGSKSTEFAAWVRQVNECVPSVDEGVGALIAALKETGQLANTLVIYTADQGFAMGEHGLRMKIAPYDASYRSPLIVSMPGTVAAGKVCRQTPNAPDLVATFFALAGVKPPDGLHGRDITPLLKNPAAPWPHPCLYEHTGHDFGNDVAKVLRENPQEAIYQKVPWYTAVVQDGWKYIRYLQPGVPEELYDLGTDPDELKNVIGEPKYAEQLSRLRAALAAELKRTAAPTVMLPPAR